MTTNLPQSEQSGNLDNISVTRSEFRYEIGVLLEYISQALGNVSGTYTTQVVNPEDVTLSGTPTLDLDTVPPSDNRTQRLPSTSWVKEYGRYVGANPPDLPPEGMMWVDNGVQPLQLKVWDDVNSQWDLLSGFESGTTMLFRQTAAPTGWTKITTWDNRALRVVSGSVTEGGNLTFTSAFSSRSQSGSVSNHRLTLAQIPPHSHGVSQNAHSHSTTVSDPGHAHAFNAGRADGSSESGNGDNDCFNRNQVTSGAKTGIGVGVNPTTIGISIQNNGGNGVHNHGLTVNSLDMRVQYVDVIFAARD